MGIFDWLFGKKELSQKEIERIRNGIKKEMPSDPEEAKKHVLSMVKNQSLNCYSGKKIPCEIDSICIHGDNVSSLATAKSIKKNLVKNNLNLKPLNKLKKFT